MGDLEPVSDRDIDRVSAAWLASQAGDEHSKDLVESWQDTRFIGDDYEAMWRFVLKLCEDVEPDDTETIGAIGVDPLWGMVNRWPDTTLRLAEAEAATNPTLVQALAIVLTSEQSVRNRMDAILARHGIERR
jgi:hypothetical protein